MAKAKKVKKSKKHTEKTHHDSSLSSNSSNSNSSDNNSSASSDESCQLERKHANKKQYRHKEKLDKKLKKTKHNSKQHRNIEKNDLNSTNLNKTDNTHYEQDVKPKKIQMDTKLIKVEKDIHIKEEHVDKISSKWESPQIKRRSRSRSRSHSRGRDYKPRQKRIRSRSRDDTKISQNQDESRQRDKGIRDKYQRHRDYYRNNDRIEEYKVRKERRQYSRSPRRSQDRSRDRNNVRRDNYSQRESYNKRRSDESHNKKSYEWGGGGKNRTENESSEENKKKIKNDITSNNCKPDYGLSGILAEDTNKVNGVVIKYSEPPEARKPKRRWRLYPFKGETALPVLHIHRQSCFLVGRDRKVADLAVDHPSCSKQHAALQYRLVPFQREDGTQGKRVRLYIIDLDSANGTFLNNKPIDSRKYYELMEKDVIKFGFSTREYVLLHENSKEDQEDDDVKVKIEPKDE